MSISGYAQGIEQGFLKEPGSAAHIILEESRRLTELVKSSFDFVTDGKWRKNCLPRTFICG